ncbi:MAG: hypothetical protein MUF87_11695 [Anaerolineae bacterium]|jgi:hypothetical protein|nr:hypothetical protein [Anaerolineae bacterium]
MKRWFLATCALLVIVTSTVSAHVKWFADFSFATPPLTFNEVITPAFIALTLLSCAVIGSLVLIDRRLEPVTWYGRINSFLEQYRPQSALILRLGLGMTLLLSWQADSLMVPDLQVVNPVIGWAQFALVLLLLTPQTTPFAAFGTALLWGYGTTQYGFFYMLDYAHFLGVAYYLIVYRVPNARVSGSAIPALYATLGFSLCWLALEKLVYPGWGLLILEERPYLTLGLPGTLFLTIAAFVEFSLGYLLIINLLQRPLALVVTLVFFTTTLFFGKVEVIGHTLLHAILIVFLIEGPGQIYRAPITFHQRTPMRVAFAAVNFVLVLMLLLLPYTYGARQNHEFYVAQAAETDNP